VFGDPVDRPRADFAQWQWGGTLGGPIRRGKTESITGPVSIAASLARDGALDVDTHSGRVEIALPRDGDALFDVVALTGAIRNEITTARAVADLPLRGTELHFSTRPDDSLPRVGIRTFKGEVVLRRR